MSDFDSGFWSYYVAAMTLASILACLLLDQRQGAGHGGWRQ